MFLLCLLILPVVVLSARDDCQKFATCALDKCVKPPSKVRNKAAILPLMIGNTNFGCVFGPSCVEECTACPGCQYAQMQIKRVIVQMPTEGKCPALESCAMRCLQDEPTDPFGCVFHRRCLNFCLNEVGCPQCHSVVRRVFNGFCQRGHYQDQFGEKCRSLFTEAVLHLVPTK